MYNKFFLISVCAVFSYSCTNSLRDNIIPKARNKNDKIHDSLAEKMKVVELEYVMSVRKMNSDSIFLSRDSIGIGPKYFKIQTQIDSLEIIYKGLKFELDSIYRLTSAEYKQKFKDETKY